MPVNNLRVLVLKLSMLVFSLLIFANFMALINAQDRCDLNVYVWDDKNNSLQAYIYVNDSFVGYNDHVLVQVSAGDHVIEATKPGYESDSATATCPGSNRVDLTLHPLKEIEIELGNLNIDPDSVCVYEEKTIEFSIPVTFEGPDNTRITARFYVEDDGWVYVGSDEKVMNDHQTKTFTIYYEYNAHDLDEGYHNVKVVVEDESTRKTAYSSMYVESCEYVIDVGFITLEPEEPGKGEIITVTTPIRLRSGKVPVRVFMKAYVDGEQIRSKSELYEDLGSRKFRFTIDTDEYSVGIHEIKVKATVNGFADASRRSFVIGGIYAKEPRRCLVIEDIRVSEPLQPGRRIRVYADVMSCGEEDEVNNQARLEAFSKTHSTGYFDIPAGESREIFFTVAIPDDASGKQTFKLTVWNDEASDKWKKDFAVSVGIPFIEIEREFLIEECETKKITFDVLNTGEVSDTFTLRVTGSAADWITGVPEAITLEPDEKKTVSAYISVPCETEPGYHELTVTAESLSEHSVTSAVRVEKRWVLGKKPLEIFALTSSVLLVLLLISVLWLYRISIESRRKPMFE